MLADMIVLELYMASATVDKYFEFIEVAPESIKTLDVIKADQSEFCNASDGAEVNLHGDDVSHRSHIGSEHYSTLPLRGNLSLCSKFRVARSDAKQIY